MKSAKWVGLFLVAALLSACAEDECTLSKEAIKPAIRKADVKNYEKAFEKDGRFLTEKAVLPSGISVTRTVGGCAHYAYSFTFENIPDSVKEAAANRFVLARNLLAQVPLVNDEYDPLLDTMKQEPPAAAISSELGDTTEFACGDANCSIEATSSGLTVGYDFAL